MDRQQVSCTSNIHVETCISSWDPAPSFVSSEVDILVLHLFFDSFEFSPQALLYSQDDTRGFPMTPHASRWDDDNFLKLLTQDQHFLEKAKG